MATVDLRLHFGAELHKGLQFIGQEGYLRQPSLLVTGLRGMGVSAYLQLLENELKIASITVKPALSGRVLPRLAAKIDCKAHVNAICTRLESLSRINILIDNAHLLSNAERTLLVSLVKHLAISNNSDVRFIFAGLPSLTYQFYGINKVSNDHFLQVDLTDEISDPRLETWAKSSLLHAYLYLNANKGLVKGSLQAYVENNIYSAPYFELNTSGREYILAIAKNTLSDLDKNIHSLSRVRDDLLRQGLIYTQSWGKVELAIPNWANWLKLHIK